LKKFLTLNLDEAVESPIPGLKFITNKFKKKGYEKE